MEPTTDLAPAPRGVEPILTAAGAGVALLMLATWAPHYLTWPWWIDLDAYATIAQGWDRGVRPYRDVTTFNFPGQIYLFWLLGRAFGWGQPAAIYAADLALLLLLGAALVGWGRRRLGGALPGLIGFVAFLGYYLGLDYSLVAQRDWQGTLFAVLGLLAIQAPRGPARLAASAVAFGVGFAFRPHIVLFLPAAILALDESARAPGQPMARTLREGLAWGALLASAVAMAFLPLIASGLLDDMVRTLPLARSQSRSPLGPLRAFADQFRDGRVLLLATALAAMARRAGPADRRMALPWAVALGASLVYAPLHPAPHAYLAIPMNLLMAINLAVLAGLARGAFRGHASASALAMTALLVIAAGRVPAYCSAAASARAVRDLAAGATPAQPPPGAEGRWRASGEPGYAWDDYRGAIAYVRANTRPGTRVANALRNFPFPTFNGPAGRVSPWTAASGVVYLGEVDAGREPEYARCLDGPPDDVVVWAPGEEVRAFRDRGFRTPLLERAIRRLYAPEARFGAIEVWRRRADPLGRTTRVVRGPDSG